jgi:hypothetical protein
MVNVAFGEYQVAISERAIRHRGSLRRALLWLRLPHRLHRDAQGHATKLSAVLPLQVADWRMGMARATERTEISARPPAASRRLVDARGGGVQGSA